MIVLFLVDTSASMNVRTDSGLSYLDCAKSAIQHFIKVRSREPNCRNDRYILMTTDEDKKEALKAGWKDTFATFTTELKTMRARGLTNHQTSIQRAFDVLNQFRIPSRIDNFGYGRKPWFFEPAMLLYYTDDGVQCSTMGLAGVSAHKCSENVGNELYGELHRWDQRFFACILGKPNKGVSSTDRGADLDNCSPYMASLAESSFGRVFHSETLHRLLFVTEKIVSNMHSGVVVSFQPMKGGASAQKAVLGVTVAGLWPVPESYVPTSSTKSLPPREPHPMIYYSQSHMIFSEQAAMAVPRDKYRLIPGPLTAHLEQHLVEGEMYPCFVKNSLGDGSLGKPFGALRRGNNGVYLLVFPYNFPELVCILERMVGTGNGEINDSNQISALKQYSRSIPPYYVPGLKTMMKRLSHLFPDQDLFAGSMAGRSISSIIVQAKSENDRIEASQQEYREMMENKKKSSNAQAKRSAVVVVDRGSICAQLARMRNEFNKSVGICNVIGDEGAHSGGDPRFSLPIADMGNFKDILLRHDLPRDPFVPDNEDRLSTLNFGNPYARGNQKALHASVSVDEPDGMNTAKHAGNRKRPRPDSPPSPKPHPPGRKARQSDSVSVVAPLSPPSVRRKTSTDGSPKVSTAQVHEVLPRSTSPCQPFAEGMKPGISSNLHGGGIPEGQVLHREVKRVEPKASSPPSSALTQNVALATDESVKHNQELKSAILKDLRKPGNGTVLAKLGMLTGPRAAIKAVVDEVVAHAKRFKKAALISEIEKAFGTT